VQRVGFYLLSSLPRIKSGVEMTKLGHVGRWNSNFEMTISAVEKRLTSFAVEKHVLAALGMTKLGQS
jgi:hypothetical protein